MITACWFLNENKIYVTFRFFYKINHVYTIKRYYKYTSIWLSLSENSSAILL